MTHKLFQELSRQEQVDFFVHCQDILVKFHPTSPFVCTADNLAHRVRHMHSLITQYKGYCYMDDNVAALYNKLVYSPQANPADIIKNQMYQTPSPDYNAAIIDFVAFRQLSDCVALVQNCYDTRMTTFLYVKRGQIKTFPAVTLMSQLLNVPVV